MLKRFLFLFLITICFAGQVSGQLFKKVERADSLAIANDFKPAMALLDSVLQQRPRNFLKAQVYYQLSYCYMQLYDFEKAKQFNQQSLDIRNKIFYEFVAGNYMRFGTISLLENQVQQALNYFEEAKNLPHEDLQFSGILEGYYGVANQRLGNSELALEHLENSLEILEYELGSNHPDVSVARYNLGNYHASVGDIDKGMEYYEKAIVTELRSTWGDQLQNLRIARASNALGTLYFNDKKDFDEAASLFEQALRSSKGFNRNMAQAWLNIAEVDFAKNAFDNAIETIDKALYILNPDEEEYPEYFIPMIIDKDLYIRGLQLKSKAQYEQFLMNSSYEVLEKAYNNATYAVEVFEGKLLDYQIENSKLNLLADNKDVFENAIYLALKMYDQKQEDRFLDAAFYYAEKGKAIVLKNQLQMTQKLLSEQLPESLVNKEKILRQKLAFLQTDLAVKYEADNFRKALLQAQRDYSSLIRQIEKSSPRYYQLRYYTSTATIKSVQDKLEQDEVLLSYFMGNELYYVFAVNKTEHQVYFMDQDAPLPEKTKLSLKFLESKAQGGFKVPKGDASPRLPKPDDGIYTQVADKDMGLKAEVVKGLRGTKKMSKKQFVAFSHSLYRRLIEPVKPILHKKKKLIIIPHGDLHFVSFESLLKAKPKKKRTKYSKFKYLIKDYSIAYENAADFFLQRRLNAVEPNRVSNFAAWAPVFNPEDDLGYTLDAEDVVFDSLQYHEEPIRSLTPDGRTFQKLEHSENEVQQILGLLGKKGIDARGYFKSEATESVFKDQAADFSHLHLATHSFVDANRSTLSGIAFSAKEPKEDGILFSGEIAIMDLKNTKLVVLSSCESGSGAMVKGEGLLSLNRAFHLAGVEHTLSTRWKVTDQYTAKLMVYFYNKLLSGATYPEALRYAQLKMIKKSKTAAPRLWAPFKLTGS